MNRLEYIFIALFLIFGFSSFAQVKDKGYNEEVVIIGSTNPTVNQSKKINLMPDEPVQPEINTDFKFNPINKYFLTPSGFVPVKPANIKVYGINDIYNNIVKVGFGTRISPYAEFFHTQVHKGKYKFDLHVGSHSTLSGIKDYTDTKYSNSVAEAGFSKYFKYHTLEFNAGYRFKSFRYFYQKNLINDSTFDSNNYKQGYNLIFFNSKFFSSYKNNDNIHHSVNLGGYYLFNKRSGTFAPADELNVSAKTDLHKAYNVSDILEYQHLGGSADIEYYRNNGVLNTTDSNFSITSSNDVLISLTPYFKARYGIVAFKAGINFSYLNMLEGSHFRVFPDLYVNVNLYPEYLEFYAGIDGKYRKNSFKMLSTENMFIDNILPDTWKADKARFFGGFRGNISKIIGFNMNISWTAFNDEYFYTSTIPPDSTLNAFKIKTDDGSVTEFNSQVSYNLTGNVEIYTTYNFRFYNLDSLLAPAGKNLSEMKIGGSFLLAGRFKPWTEVTFNGVRYGLSSDNLTRIKLDTYVDFNLGIDYYHDENLSAFIKVTNLLNKNYQKYYMLPGYGIEFMFGVGYKF